MLHLFDFSPLCKCDLREIGCFSIRTEWIKMLWVWTQFSAQSRFFVPFIDGVKPVGGNATIVKLDCCSIIAHGRHRVQGGFIVVHYIVYCIVHGTGWLYHTPMTLRPQWLRHKSSEWSRSPLKCPNDPNLVFQMVQMGADQTSVDLKSSILGGWDSTFCEKNRDCSQNFRKEKSVLV